MEHLLYKDGLTHENGVVTSLTVCLRCSNQARAGKVLTFGKQNITFGNVPNELKILTNSEIDLISLVRPFMSVYTNPNGGQSFTKGNVLNLPNNVSTLCKKLPRNPENVSSICMVERYNRRTHKVRAAPIRSALVWLKQRHRYYYDRY